MRNHRDRSLLPARFAGLLLVLLAAPALGQKDPKFEYGKHEEVKAVEWKASAKLGLVISSGNSQSGSGSLGASVSRKAGGNKFALDGGWTYVRSRVLQAADVNNSGFIDPAELIRSDQELNNSWNVKARYDRFFTTNNSAYLVGMAAGDPPAGKDIVGGGQLGYSRQLVKTPRHEAVVEAGYDFSYEGYVDGKSVNIHSLRLFTGYNLKITDSAGAFGNVEGLFNVAPEKVPVAGGGDEAGPFRDTRINFKVGLSSTFFKKLSISLSFGVKYDNVPAPLPAFKIAYAPGFVPFAEKTDTLTEAALIYSFL